MRLNRVELHHKFENCLNLITTKKFILNANRSYIEDEVDEIFCSYSHVICKYHGEYDSAVANDQTSREIIELFLQIHNRYMIETLQYQTQEFICIYVTVDCPFDVKYNVHWCV